LPASQCGKPSFRPNEPFGFATAAKKHIARFLTVGLLVAIQFGLLPAAKEKRREAFASPALQ
jgi:hypothetical protein